MGGAPGSAGREDHRESGGHDPGWARVGPTIVEAAAAEAGRKEEEP